MDEMSDRELEIRSSLTQELREAFNTVRNQGVDAGERLRKAELLPDEALQAIGNVVCKVILDDRRRNQTA